MSNTHRIRVREPAWILHELTLEEEDELPDRDWAMTARIGEIEIDDAICDRPGSDTYYECTCGLGFDEFDRAEAHLVDIKESDDGEAVTPPDGSDVPDVSDLEIVQMMAAQAVVMDHHGELHDEYVANVKRLAEAYGVEVPAHYDA